MKSLGISRRILTLALCLMMVLAIAAPAMAAPIAAYGIIAQDNTPVYGNVSKTTIIGSFGKDDVVAIESQDKTKGLLVVRTNATTADIGYIDISAVSKTAVALPSGKSVASMKAASGSATGGTTSGSAGTITNCKSSVNFRATASASGKKLGTLKLNEKVTVLGEENGFYKITNSKGVTGYVAKAYCTVSAGTGSTGTGTGTGSAVTAGTGKIQAGPSGIAVREKADGSSARQGTVYNGDTVTIRGTSGNYTLIESGSMKGYIPTSNIAAGTVVPSTPDAGSSTTSGTQAGQAGKIANCKSNVNFRATASASGKLLGTLKLGESITVLGTEGSFYKITNSKGVTGYVSNAYVSITGSGSTTTPSTPGGDSSSGTTTTGKDKNGIKVEPGSSSPISTVANGLAAAKKKNSDTVGYIYIANTNISYPILYNKNVNYYDSYSIDKKKSSAGAVHSFYNVTTRNNTITAHNMRGSNQMFHQLSHIYDKTMGYSTCQTTDYKCAAASLSNIPSMTNASNRIWDINYMGYNKWEVWAMYKTAANEPKSTLNNNIAHLSDKSPAQVKTWIDGQKSRSAIKINTDVSTEDVLMTVYTCGTNYDYAAAQSRIYFFLKAVK